MRWKLGVSLTAAAVGVLTLAGCLGVVPPPPPATKAETAAFYDDVLAKSWVSTGLSDAMARPTVEAEDATEVSRWVVDVVNCMSEQGFPVFQVGYDPAGGFIMVDEPTSVPVTTDRVAQLEFYICLARHPMGEGSFFLTPTQLNYIYDYFQDKILPCMALHGFAIDHAPSREDFIAIDGAWDPYQELQTETKAFASDKVTQLCGPAVVGVS